MEKVIGGSFCGGGRALQMTVENWQRKVGGKAMNCARWANESRAEAVEAFLTGAEPALANRDHCF